MSVLGALGSPSAVDRPYGIFDGVEQVVDIIVHVGLLVEEMMLVVAVHPFRAGHARRGNIHGIAAHVFAQLVELMVAQSVGTVVRLPLAPLSRPLGYVADGLLPVVHRLLVNAMDDAAAREAQEVGTVVDEVLQHVGTEH